MTCIHQYIFILNWVHRYINDITIKMYNLYKMSPSRLRWPKYWLRFTLSINWLPLPCLLPLSKSVYELECRNKTSERKMGHFRNVKRTKQQSNFLTLEPHLALTLEENNIFRQWMMWQNDIVKITRKTDNYESFLPCLHQQADELFVLFLEQIMQNNYYSDFSEMAGGPCSCRVTPTRCQCTTPSPLSSHTLTRQAGHDTTRHDTTRHDKTRQDTTRKDKTRQDKIDSSPSIY